MTDGIRVVCDSRKHVRNVRLDAFLEFYPMDESHHPDYWLALSGDDVTGGEPDWDYADGRPYVVGFVAYKITCPRCHASVFIAHERLQDIWDVLPESPVVVPMSVLRKPRRHAVAPPPTIDLL